MAERTIEIARTALEAAWARARDNPSAETGVAYADAHAAWTDLARRRVGRPASSDGAALTGPERAQALRGRQQDSAGKWTRVAPVIQSLRGAVRAGDLNAVSAAVRALVNETSVTLDRITVIHAHPSSDQTVLEGWDARTSPQPKPTCLSAKTWRPSRGRWRQGWSEGIIAPMPGAASPCRA